VSLALVATAALLFLLSIGSRGCIEQGRVRWQRKRIEARIRELEKSKALMETEKKSLDDPAVVEKIAREEYGMSKKGEKVYRVVPKGKK
jgi:cell division protein FtsB